MKCLSVCQPFAELIIQGKKTIELRKWNTKFRGEFLVHAPQKIRLDDCKRLKIKPEMVIGAIIGKVELIDVRKYENVEQIKNDSKKHLASIDVNDTKYGFILQNPMQLRIPIPCTGKLNFFEFKPELTKINEIKTELFEEEHRYMWINHH
ncbi:MAG: ASCH domain-containing protein [Candidatus Nitrosopelagicus sp.]|jgi:ASC-1-like (ASCH) protein|nr:ASCH domain-containing protein [Candidatus Nitrosopelagicus sp.]